MAIEDSVIAAADSAPPLAQMAHSAVSLRNSSKGRTSVAISNWDEHKARTVNTWASGLQAGEHPDTEDERIAGRNRTMRFGIGRFSATVGEGHRENNGVYRGRQETAGLEHPNLHLWSNSTSKVGGERKTANVGERYTNAHTPRETTAPPRGLPNSIPSRFTNTLSASSQRRDISKASSTRSSAPVLVVPYTPPPRLPSAPASATSHTSRFSFSSLAPARIPKNFYKMRSSGPPPSLPPVSEFDIQNIMEWAKHDDDQTGTKGVAADLERIAEICARSRLSLANQYERHMPPHGPGHGYSTYERMGAEVDVRAGGPAQRRARKGKSKAFETLETIYASSSSGRSSKDGKGRKRSPLELAAEVKLRNEREAKHAPNGHDAEREGAEDADYERSVIEGIGGRDNHVRREGLIVGSRHTHAGKDGKRRMKLSAVVIDTASSNDGSNHSSRPLRSKPLKPRTSNVEMGVSTAVEAIAVHEQTHNTEHVASHTPHIPISAPEPEIATIPLLHDCEQAVQDVQASQSVLGTFSTWLPWLRRPEASVEEVPTEALTETYFEVLPSAEGSLKRLLDATEKGKRGSGGRNRGDG